jgi:murein DD-endopeptidase MepM/ murein hydrolase activator NlpD
VVRLGIRLRTLPLLFSIALLSGCTSVSPKPAPQRAATPPVRHTVRAGETIYRIAGYYGVSSTSIIRANRIGDVRKLLPGRSLLIPGSRRRPPVVPLSPRERGRGQSGSRLDFAWPVRGTLTSRYGRRWGRRHDGIDIGARSGTQVAAAERGRVIYSGNGLGAYGNVVIIRHPGNFETVYAHNRRNRVRRGDIVRKGQVIAEVGATGNATGPHLHFEVRKKNRAFDPLRFLP